MKIAVARYPIDAPGSVEAFAGKQSAWVAEAAAGGARVVVLPEYLSLELAAAFPEPVRAELASSLRALQSLREAWVMLFRRLARQHGVYLVPGTFLLEVDGRFRNRADVFTPDGGHLWQDKLQLTGFEKATGLIDGGDALKVFDVDGVRVGVAVCYDVEFPLPVRAQAEAGAQVILVPSCTDTEAGATRVRVGCLARALENRCYVAQAVTAGEAAWSPALDVNTGDAAVYAPMDVGLPADGVLARTQAPGWAFAEVDVDALQASRAHAQVANDRDWAGQCVPALRSARLVTPD